LTCSFRFISEHRAVFGVARLCRVLGVRRPGVYEWLAAGPGRAERAAADERLATEIAGLHAEHRGAYGRPRVTAALRRRGRVVNHKPSPHDCTRPHFRFRNCLNRVGPLVHVRGDPLVEPLAQLLQLRAVAANPVGLDALPGHDGASGPASAAMANVSIFSTDRDPAS
jgi:hypothetical protein